MTDIHCNQLLLRKQINRIHTGKVFLMHSTSWEKVSLQVGYVKVLLIKFQHHALTEKNLFILTTARSMFFTAFYSTFCHCSYLVTSTLPFKSGRNLRGNTTKCCHCCHFVHIAYNNIILLNYLDKYGVSVYTVQ